MSNFPEKVGHLVFVEDVSRGKARYRCTYEGCTHEVIRDVDTMKSALRRMAESACKKCGKKLATKRFHRERAARFKTNVRPRELDAETGDGK